jgi:predicted DNA-binding ribbon-helix-helix protein
MKRLVIRSFQIRGRQLHVRLEHVIWDALYDIARQKHCSIGALVAEIDDERGKLHLTAALRRYVVAYYRVRLRGALSDYPIGRRDSADHRCRY